MGKINKLLPKSTLGRGVVTLASGTAFSQVITAAAMPVVTRLYVPAEIGIISLFIAFFGFWSTLLSWRYESAVLVARTDVELQLVFRIGVLCVFLMSVISAPVLFLLVDFHVFGFGVLPNWSVLAAVPVFLGFGLFMMYRSWGLRAGHIRDITRATVARSASNAVTRIVLGLAGLGVGGLFAAEVAGAWGAAGTLRRSFLRHRSEHQVQFTFEALKSAAYRYVKFAKYEMPSVAVNQLALTLPVPIIAALYGAKAAGWFGLARLLVAIPNAQIGRAVADVFQMELARHLREGNLQAGYRLFFRLFTQLAIFGLVPLAGVMILGPLLVPWVFGKPWREMGFITAYIAPWLYASLIVTSLSRLLSVLERQEYKLIYDITGVLLVLAVYGIALKYQLTLDWTVILLACFGVFSYVIYLIILIHIVRKDLKFGQ